MERLVFGLAIGERGCNVDVALILRRCPREEHFIARVGAQVRGQLPATVAYLGGFDSAGHNEFFGLAVVAKL